MCLRTVTLAVLFKCLESSLHMRLYMSLHVFKDCDTCCFVQVSRVVHAHAFVCLYTCLRTVTLAVLFKCLESSMHMRLYMSLHVLKD